MNTFTKRTPLLVTLYLLLVLFIFSLPVKADDSSAVTYHTVSIENVDIFYREAPYIDRMGQ